MRTAAGPAEIPDGQPYPDDMRHRETIDSELTLLAAVRRSVREEGGSPPSIIEPAYELLDERLEPTDL
jgi:hypothetical protein